MHLFSGSPFCLFLSVTYLDSHIMKAFQSGFLNMGYLPAFASAVACVRAGSQRCVSGFYSLPLWPLHSSYSRCLCGHDHCCLGFYSICETCSALTLSSSSLLLPSLCLRCLHFYFYSFELS
jgi:hypothetical protein